MADFEKKQPMLDRRHFVGGALATSALAALAGCTGGNGGTTAGSGSAAAEAPTVGENYMSYYLSEPAFIDPYNGQENQGMSVIAACFNGLVTWDYDTNEPVALAAADLPTVSEDGLTYTFTLREGMAFHNGDPVDAASFKRGWERMVDPSMATPGEVAYHLAPVAGYAEYAAGEADEITGLVAVDDLTFQVTLSAPMADFTAVCCHPALVPVPQAALDDPASFLEQPIGNGPFKMDEPWQHNQYILCSRFEDYFGEAPAIDGVYFSIQADPDTAFRGFQAGEIDFTNIPVGQVNDCVEQYGQSEDGFTVTPGAQVLTGTELSTYYLIPNLTDENLSKKEVRQALSLAIDRQAIVDTLFEGYREPANSIMPLSIDDNEENIWEYCAYDPERAKQILADAGVDPASISVTLDYNSGGDHEDIMSAIQANLADIGVTVTQNTLEWAAYLDSLSDGSYGLARLGWTADYPIQDNFLYPNFFSTADNNYNGYNNPDVDAAILAARQIQDEEERRAAYRTICHQIGEDMPVIPIMFYAHNYVGSERLAHFFYDAATIPHFDTAQLA